MRKIRRKDPVKLILKRELPVKDLNVSNSCRFKGCGEALWHHFVSLSKTHLFPRVLGDTHEVVAPSQHDRKVVDRDINLSTNKNQRVLFFHAI